MTQTIQCIGVRPRENLQKKKVKISLEEAKKVRTSKPGKKVKKKKN